MLCTRCCRSSSRLPGEPPPAAAADAAGVRMRAAAAPEPLATAATAARREGLAGSSQSGMAPSIRSRGESEEWLDAMLDAHDVRSSEWTWPVVRGDLKSQRIRGPRDELNGMLSRLGEK